MGTKLESHLIQRAVMQKRPFGTMYRRPYTPVQQRALSASENCRDSVVCLERSLRLKEDHMELELSGKVALVTGGS